MKKTDAKFTSLVGDLLIVTQGIGNWGTGKGLIDQKKLRLTVMARQVEAKRLIASGVSTRQAAKALGVSNATVHRDVQGRVTKGNKNGTKSNTRPAQEKLVDQIDHENPQNFLTAFLLRVDQATTMAKDAKTLVPNIFSKTKPKKNKLIEMLQMSRHAGKLWEGIALELENRGVKYD